MLPIQLTQDEFERIASDVVAGIVQEALLVMQRRVQDAGFVLTGDLLRSLHLQTVVLAKDLYAEFSIGFAGYGRYRDMRKLLFHKMPPIEVMEDFVQQIGVENFQYVPGYLTDAKRRAIIPDSRAINRIAWGIRASMRQHAQLRDAGRSRKSRNAFYNPARGKLIYSTSAKLLEALPEPIMKAIKQRLED